MPPSYRTILTGIAAALAFVGVDARACIVMPPEPRIEGESDAAYTARVEALERERAAAYLKERQTEALRQADRVFIARDIGYWSPPYHPPRVRPGQIPPPPPRLMPIPFPAPNWFRTVEWLRGTPSRGVFKVETSQTSCGFHSLGDTTNSAIGQLYVFFARKGPLSDKTLIDAIAVDRISDPALIAFVAKYRGKPKANQALLPPIAFEERHDGRYARTQAASVGKARPQPVPDDRARRRRQA